LLEKVASYDITCQWSIHLLERLAALPSHVRPIIPTGTLRYVIPKLHIHSHKLNCQLNYSLNLLLALAELTARALNGCGESEPIANSTKEMGPGAHHDTINDHWGHWNWQKTVGLGGFFPLYSIRVILNVGY